MLILNQEDVRAALPMAEAIAATRWAYEAWSTGQAKAPARVHLSIPDTDAVSLFMPAYVSGREDGGYPSSLAVKAVSVFPSNVRRGLATIQGAVLLLDAQTGACLALLDGAALTALRTGAGSAVATDLLARPESAVLAILGAGAQARAQIEAVCEARTISTVQVYSRTAERAMNLIETLAGRGAIPDDIRLARSARDAVRDADIICTATTACHPLFEDADVKPGAHLNAIGAFRPEMQEISPATVQRSRVYVDNRFAALTEAGDLVQAKEAGLIDASHLLGEIGEVLCGRVMGRTGSREITLFKSVGMAAQDAVAAEVAYTQAIRRGLGQQVHWTDS